MLKYHVASLYVGIDKRIIIIIQVMHDIEILEVGKDLTSTTRAILSWASQSYRGSARRVRYWPLHTVWPSDGLLLASVMNMDTVHYYCIL